MSFITSSLTESECFLIQNFPRTFIDVLYDHRAFLDGHDGYLGPEPIPAGKTVAIVGAGPAGLMAGWLLLKMGVRPEIFEADASRVGGRVYSHHPSQAAEAVFEMGAMRVPRSEQLFQFFADKFSMEHSRFADPGVVNTLLYYQNKRYEWRAGGELPGFFHQVNTDWNHFAGVIMAPVSNALARGEYALAQQLWQTFLTGEDYNWSTTSFYSGLARLFPDWGPGEFGLFGALGIGSGGFGPLYRVNFAEFARLIVNGLETCQQFYPGGLSQLTDGIYTDPVQLRGQSDETSLKLADAVKFGTTVIGVAAGEDGRLAVSFTPTTEARKFDPCSTPPRLETKMFDAVVLATTSRSMQIDIGITQAEAPAKLLVDEGAADGIREMHLMNSSKVFLVTETKFWQTIPGQWSNIQTDGLCRGVYCLDYPGTEKGVVLLSYTWGDDSTKLIAVKDPQERFDILARSLRDVDENFFQALCTETIKDSITLIDWQDQANYYGAFKLNYPGQDVDNQAAYYQFLDVLSNDQGVYLAGDSVGWSAGWIESALQTGVNAAASVVYRLLGPTGLYQGSPLVQNAGQYTYGN